MNLSFPIHKHQVRILSVYIMRIATITSIHPLSDPSVSMMPGPYSSEHGHTSAGHDKRSNLMGRLILQGKCYFRY